MSFGLKIWTCECLPVVVKLQESEVLVSQSNAILTAIVHGMKREEPSDYVRLAATNALLNSLEFTKANFDNEVYIFEPKVRLNLSVTD